ncbi:MAG: hypothetical protein IKO80_07750, partial [Lachnospiraceae bacterium]|nr:hypothetical protein [Lachnospiraceae bacterium]
KILSNEDADYVTGETLKSITKDLQKAAEAYKKFAARIGSDCQVYTAQEILSRRMQALRLNERKIKLYRMQYPDVAERDAGIQEMIAAYEDGLRWEAVRTFTKRNEQESSLSGLIEKHVEEEGEVEHTEKLSFADQTEGLEPEQLRGIEAIDNWLIRNFQNGGLAGAAITAVKNSHEDFVSALLSLTKRERLHMYYLVETGKRKNPGVVDVGASQSSVYTPDLEAFKDQMLATKWKFWTRITGGYTYMNKLSQAFRKTMEYRREIQSLAALKNEKKELAEKLEKGSNAGTVEQTALLRQSRLIELKGALEEYYRNLKSAEKAKGRMKGAEEAKCREAAEYCQNLMKELVRLDSLLGEAYKAAEDGEDVPDTVSTAASQTATLAGLPNNAIAGLNAANDFFDKPWNLETAGWSKANLWTGGVAGAAGSVANLVGAVTTLIALKDSWAHMSGEERAEKILSITGSAFSAVENGVKIAELVEKGGSLSRYATAGEVTQTAGTVVGAAGSVISGGIAIAKTVGAAKMASHGSHASDYFLKKREGAALEKDLYGDISKEKKRELKYEKNMMLLQQDLTKREAKNAATAWVDAGLSVAGIFVPGLGVVSACFSVVSSIIDSKVVSGIRTRLFDNFFNMDSLVDKAAASKDAQRLLRLPDLKQADRETFKESLRKRVAACAGFCDMSAAAEEICGKFARLIREKLFGGKAESDEEKNGYIEFVRALNLSYNEQKELPAENILMRKLSAQ